MLLNASLLFIFSVYTDGCGWVMSQVGDVRVASVRVYVLLLMSLLPAT